jgi:streptogramin lyase
VRKKPGHRALALLIVALICVALGGGRAEAAEPTAYELPDATHARSLAVANDGTVWFAPRRGSEWSGGHGPVVAALTPGGSVAEYDVKGIGSVGHVALGPADEVWISGESGRFHKEVFEIARLSPTGQVERRFIVGHGDGPYLSFVRELSVSANAVWFVRQRSSRPESIERLDPTSGAIRQFVLRPRCRATALQPAPDGTLWFTEKCGDYVSRGPSTPTDASLGRIEPNGRIVRQSIVAADYPVALAIGPEGTVWFGALRRYNHPDQIGRLTKAGNLAEFPVPDGFPTSIAVGAEGRLWFQGSFGGRVYGAIDSIGLGGSVGKPVCAYSGCGLEPADLTSAPDGSFWYGLVAPNLNTGGGGAGLGIEMEIANEAGFIGHLVP